MSLIARALILLSLVSTAIAAPADYFAIQCVDEETNRPIPMVELTTTYGQPYYTDSNGWVAFNEPGLMNRRVYFGVASHGYECAPDGFGSRGRAFTATPGQSATIKLKRLNIAERLYRMTGAGIYRDTLLLGKKAPTTQPLLDAEVTGQDGILTAFYKGKLYWFWGDTIPLAYPLGNFQMTGAVSDPPDKLDPEQNFDLRYFTKEDGFARPMCPIKGEGVVWLAGLVVLKDPKTHDDRMLAFYQRRRGLGPVLENGFAQWNDASEQFEPVKPIEQLDPPNIPTGYPTPFPLATGNSQLATTDYLYFTHPYPTLRVRADYDAYLDLSQYECFTCLKPGTFAKSKDDAQLDRDPAGKLTWSWKKNTGPLNPAIQRDLIKTGKMKPDESPLRLTDVDTKKPVLINNCSCFWNDYRKKYVMIACQHSGDTMLGEIYFAESAKIEGPWTSAKKIITHANKPNDAHDFYNPTHHPFLDRQGGRVIYLEGSYVNTFSGNPHPTPWYEYNQIMYRLDLADPRLKFPSP